MSFSKLFISIVFGSALLFLGMSCSNNNGSEKDSKANDSSVAKTKSKEKANEDIIKIGVVTWGGYAGGQYFNEGFEASDKSRFFKDYGFKVEFKVLDDFEASRNAFRGDEVHLLWQTIDCFPTEVNGLGDFDPVIAFQADWSRGGDAIVARRGISKISDLKGKKIAVAELTPSHSFLLWMLEANNVSLKDVTIVPQASAIDAAEIFKSERVDAAVVWSPDDILCTKAVAGSRVLESTSAAGNIIADVFMAKRAWLSKNEAKVRQLYEGWMIGAAEINNNKNNRTKAAKILAEEFTERGTALTVDEADQMIGNVRLVTHGDNKDFFGLTTGYAGITGNDLYTRMGKVYQDLGFIEGDIPSWRKISYPNLVAKTNLDGHEHASETASLKK